MKLTVVQFLHRYLLNPPIVLLFKLGVIPPGYAMLETIGRKSGQARRTPVGDGTVGDEFWIVAEHGLKAAYVRNLQANPRVRVQTRKGMGTVWRSGTAEALPDDDPLARQKTLAGRNLGRRRNAFIVRALGTDLVSVRIVLDPA